MLSGFRLRLFGGERHLLADKLLDRPQFTAFAGTAEGQGNSLRASAPGATDPMDIAFRFGWKVEVDDVRDAVDVNSPCGDIRRH